MPILEDGGPEDEDFGSCEPEFAPESMEAGELWCPLCGAVVYAEAVECPKCRQFITPGLPPRRRAAGRMWIVYVLLAALIAGSVIAIIVEGA